MIFFFIKSLHIIFVVTWFAGLFYIVRLFIYDTEAQLLPSPQKEILTSQYRIMKKRLWLGITWPSAILTFIFGPWLASFYWPIHHYPWLVLKFFLVLLLGAYHYSCHILYQRMNKKIYRYNSQQLRLWNEVATVFLFLIVFLVVFKSFFSLFYGISLLFGLIFALVLGIKIYQKLRS